MTLSPKSKKEQDASSVVVPVIEDVLENDEARFGKYEMNLVEHPFATLSWGRNRGTDISRTFA